MKTFLSRNTAIVLFLLLVCASAFSQKAEKSEAFTLLNTWHIGLEAGYAYNSLFTSTGYRSFTEYDSGHGFSVGIPVRYNIFKWLAIQAEPQYIQKNYTWQRTALYNESHNTYTNGFFSVPIFAQFSWNLHKGLSLFLNAGGYLGVWTHSSRRGSALEATSNTFDPAKQYYTSYNETVPFDNRRDNRFDAGLLAGIGIEYAFPAFTVFAEGRFNYGLTDLQKKYMTVQIPRMNDTWEFRAGILLNVSSLAGGKK